MIRLEYSKEPVWIELLGAIKVQVIPFRSSVMAAAKAGIEARVGMDAPAEVRFSALAYEVAKVAIIAWEGVADQDGKLAPVTADAIENLMDFFVIHEAFIAKYVTPGILMGTEKKSSVLSPSGTSEVAQNTAKAVRRHVRTVPKR